MSKSFTFARGVLVTSFALFVAMTAGGSKKDVYVYNVTACSTPCQNGTYEVISCSTSHPKLCRGK